MIDLLFAKYAGHEDADIERVWELVTGFNGYAFNKAHSTAYGMQAYQAAWQARRKEVPL